MGLSHNRAARHGVWQVNSKWGLVCYLKFYRSLVQELSTDAEQLRGEERMPGELSPHHTKPKGNL